MVFSVRKSAGRGQFGFFFETALAMATFGRFFARGQFGLSGQGGVRRGARRAGSGGLAARNLGSRARNLGWAGQEGPYRGGLFHFCAFPRAIRGARSQE